MRRPAAGEPRSGSVFEARHLTFRYPGARRPALHDVSVRVGPGTLHGVIGPNGSGKSTLLRLLLGARGPDAGDALYRGRPVRSWSRRELARRVGVVPQQESVSFPLTVRELVGMGRYPHLGAFRSEGPADRAAVAAALARCGLEELAGRPYGTLSGGERQLVRIARALAQEPEALALDEPTVSLDIRHEMEIFELLRTLVEEDGVTVLLVTHHLNAAARFAHRLLLLGGGAVAAEGPPAEVLTRATVEEVYRWPVRVTPFPGPGAGAGAPQVLPLPRDGNGGEGVR